ncbi:NUDIX hydrolase [Corynebacterium lipophiloflavum]|nr:NUDIX hydrolase [Corynebacterium lipophiloflavum]
MTDNSRATPGQGPNEAGSGGGGDRSPRPRKRRRRGSRPASSATGLAGAPGGDNAGDHASGGSGNDTSQSARSGRRRRGRGKRSQQGQQPQQPQKSQKSQKSQSGGDNSSRKRPSGRSRGAGRGRNQRQNTTQYRQNQRYPQHSDSTIETRDETSAGGLVVSGMAEAVGPGGQVDLSEIYVALIGRLDRRGRLLWSMPKGHVENGEHQWATAEREVWEETGIKGEAFEELGVIDYWFVSEGVRIHKTVHHNLLRFVDGILNDEDPEVTEVTWVPMSELIEHLAYADERKLARIAYDRMPDLARKEADAGRATPR